MQYAKSIGTLLISVKSELTNAKAVKKMHFTTNY